MGSGPVVVLDTNVLVSAFGWRGPEREVYRLARAGVVQAFTSPTLVAELERVLGYPKFSLQPSQVDRIVEHVRSVANLVAPDRKVNAVREDSSDNRVLECAVAAEADWIVSGDHHLLELERFEGIPIVSAAHLLELLGQTGE